MATIVIGCDPGLDGAFAVMVDGALIEVHDMPCMSRVVGSKERRYVSVDTVDSLLRGVIQRHVDPADSVLFALEKVGARPKEGAVGAFAFGKGVGQVEGVVVGLRLPRLEVEPSVWKRALKLKKGKDVSRQRAMEWYPEHRESFTRVKDDGRAEAALIAKWATDRSELL